MIFKDHGEARAEHPEHKKLKEWANRKLVAIDGKNDPEKFYIDYVLLNLDVYIEDCKNEDILKLNFKKRGG